MTQSDERTETEIREELSILGLSDTEIDTYLALLPRGEAPTSTIAEEADVTQRAVYNIAERLEKRGLVRVKEHASPTVIRALPPEEAIGSLSERLESITPSLEDRFNETTDTEPEIQMLKSRQTAIKRLRTSISNAEDEIFVAVPKHVYPEIESGLRSAVNRGVFVLLLVGELDTPAEIEQFEGVGDAIRYWDESLPFAFVVDDTTAMIGEPDIFSGPTTETEVVSVSQQHLTGSVLGMSLSAYWSASTELYVTDPDPLPKTYGWFRQAVFHAYLHMQQGTDLWADIETVSGELISGAVSQVRQAIIEPATNDYTLEMSLFLETDNGEVSVGGPGAFIEDYEGKTVRLRTNS
ncbi:TrmB family transcriptional regulator [Haloarcula amylovorans]|uniref:TrmB family transcriptional regulator n=1 Tax=Haloarcula amylovorans TaxID=2562280 RepID=UPI00107688EB|nr:TrmB family transcriptional regulator [Halomicroarcula amylolytica]